MKLYSVLMVDDEEEVIEIISKKLNWEEMGFKICGRARNGMEALEMAEELSPDVVMSDIKMPYMDGLELARELKKRFLDIRIIIFSGFDDFEYAKKAIGLEVEEYLLKPIDSAEIRQVFEKMRIQLDEERNRQNNIERLQTYYQKSLPLMQENFFISLIEGSLSEDKIKESLNYYRIELSGPYYAISVIHTSMNEIPTGISPRMLNLSVRQLTEKWAQNGRKNYIFSYQENVISLVELTSREEITRYTDECDRFCKLAKRTCQAVVSIGIGRVVDRICDLCISYSEARESLSYRVLYGTGTAIYIAEVEPRGQQADLRENKGLHLIFKQIKMGDEESVSEAVNQYIMSLKQAKLNIQGFRLLMMELLTGLYRFCSNNGINTEIVYPENEDIYARFLQMDSLNELSSWLLDIALSLRKIIQQRRISKNWSFVSQAKEFVRENYSNSELTIDMVCSSLNVSAAYFSTVFKKETGKTFIGYLTEYRMERAVDLLIEKNEKTYIIAQKVGYSDPNYFSYVFKKWFGMSPTKYKKQGNKN